MTHVHHHFRTGVGDERVLPSGNKVRDGETWREKWRMYKIYRFIYVLLILKYYISCWWCGTILHWIMNNKLMWIMTSKECVRKVRGPSQNNILKFKRKDSTVSKGTGCWNVGFRFTEGAVVFILPQHRDQMQSSSNLLPEALPRGKKRTERENHSHSQSAEVKRTCGASTSLSHTPSWHRV